MKERPTDSQEKFQYSLKEKFLIGAGVALVSAGVVFAMYTMDNIRHEPEHASQVDSPFAQLHK